jgi:hypothetical protein
MRKIVKGLSVLVLMLALVAGVMQGQDTSMSTGTIVCDESLITDLYIAQRYFDFGRLNDQWMQSGFSTLDLSQFDYGQYAPLFNNWSGMSTTSSPLWTEEQQNSVSGWMTLDDATFQSNLSSMYPAGTDTTTLSTLNPSTSIVDEPAECATLRSQLNRFFRVVAFQDLSPTGGLNSNLQLTPAAEATVETSG